MIETLLKILTSLKAKTKSRKYSHKDYGFFKEFLILARLEMDKNGLIDWRLELDFAKVRAGACHFGEKKITFSRNFIKNSDQYDIQDTILHEVAHALVGPQHGHDKVWKQMATELGCSAKRCHSLEFSKYKWIRFCPNLCWEQKIHRKNVNLICKKCGSGVQHKLFF